MARQSPRPRWGLLTGRVLDGSFAGVVQNRIPVNQRSSSCTIRNRKLKGPVTFTPPRYARTGHRLSGDVISRKPCPHALVASVTLGYTLVAPQLEEPPLVTSERRIYVWAAHFAICEGVQVSELRQRVAEVLGDFRSEPSQLVSEGIRRYRNCPICDKPWQRRRQRNPLSVYHQLPVTDGEMIDSSTATSRSLRSDDIHPLEFAVSDAKLPHMTDGFSTSVRATLVAAREHAARLRDLPRDQHRQGFIAATSMKFAGKVTLPCAREIVTTSRSRAR